MITAQYSLTAGLVGYYLFNNNTEDSSGYMHTPNETLSIKYVSDRSGVIQSACSFEKDSSVIILPSSKYLYLTQGTVTFWLKLYSTNQIVFSSIISQLNQSLNRGFIIKNRDNQLQIDLINNGTTNTLTGNLVFDQWHHVAFSFQKNGTADLYIDGKLVDKNILTTLVSDSENYAASSIHIGDCLYSDIFSFLGAIDDIRFYRRYMSRSEILRIYDPTFYDISPIQTIFCEISCDAEEIDQALLFLEKNNFIVYETAITNDYVLAGKDLDSNSDEKLVSENLSFVRSSIKTNPVEIIDSFLTIKDVIDPPEIQVVANNGSFTVFWETIERATSYKVYINKGYPVVRDQYGKFDIDQILTVKKPPCIVVKTTTESTLTNGSIYYVAVSAIIENEEGLWESSLSLDKSITPQPYLIAYYPLTEFIEDNYVVNHYNTKVHKDVRCVSDAYHNPIEAYFFTGLEGSFLKIKEQYFDLTERRFLSDNINDALQEELTFAFWVYPLENHVGGKIIDFANIVDNEGRDRIAVLRSDINVQSENGFVSNISLFQNYSPQIEVGLSHCLLIDPQGNLWAWGNNDYGQLGTGDLVAYEEPIQIGEDKWLQIKVGRYFSVGLKQDQTLWVWGYNEKGLGLGEDLQSLIPQQIGDESWVSIAAKSEYVLAIKKDRTLWGWGSNYYGQLGTGDFYHKKQPFQISTDQWKQVDTGTSFSVGLKKDLTLWVWGTNESGLGLEQEIIGEDENIYQQTVLRRVGFKFWKKIAAGHQHIIAVALDGSFWSWGNNKYGQLGLGFTGKDPGGSTDTSLPCQIKVSRNWKIFKAGHFFNLALDQDGNYWGWGDNSSGQLGNNSLVNIDVPQVVLSDYSHWEKIALGPNYVLGVQRDYTLWEWGNNVLIPKFKHFYDANNYIQIAEPNLGNETGSLSFWIQSKSKLYNQPAIIISKLNLANSYGYEIYEKTYFKFTKASFKFLESYGFTEDILDRIKTLNNQSFKSQDDLFSAINDLLQNSFPEFVQYEYLYPQSTLQKTISVHLLIRGKLYILENFNIALKDQLQHIVFCYSRGNYVQLYIDGICIAQRDDLPLFSFPSDPILIGGGDRTGKRDLIRFEGQIIDFSFYEQCLLKDKIYSLYHKWFPGLTAYYTFYGNLKDSSNYRNHAFLEQETAVEIYTEDRFGHANYAYLFDQTNTLVIPNSEQFSSSSGSLACWLNFNNLINSNVNFIKKNKTIILQKVDLIESNTDPRKKFEIVENILFYTLTSDVLDKIEKLNAVRDILEILKNFIGVPYYTNLDFFLAIKEAIGAVSYTEYQDVINSLAVNATLGFEFTSDTCQVLPLEYQSLSESLVGNIYIIQEDVLEPLQALIQTVTPDYELTTSLITDILNSLKVVAGMKLTSDSMNRILNNKVEADFVALLTVLQDQPFFGDFFLQQKIIQIIYQYFGSDYSLEKIEELQKIIWYSTERVNISVVREKICTLKTKQIKLDLQEGRISYYYYKKLLPLTNVSYFSDASLQQAIQNLGTETVTNKLYLTIPTCVVQTNIKFNYSSTHYFSSLPFNILCPSVIIESAKINGSITTQKIDQNLKIKTLATPKLGFKTLTCTIKISKTFNHSCIHYFSSLPLKMICPSVIIGEPVVDEIITELQPIDPLGIEISTIKLYLKTSTARLHTSFQIDHSCSCCLSSLPLKMVCPSVIIGEPEIEEVIVEKQQINQNFKFESLTTKISLKSPISIIHTNIQIIHSYAHCFSSLPFRISCCASVVETFIADNSVDIITGTQLDQNLLEELQSEKNNTLLSKMVLYKLANSDILKIKYWSEEDFLNAIKNTLGNVLYNSLTDVQKNILLKYSYHTNIEIYLQDEEQKLCLSGQHLESLISYYDFNESLNNQENNNFALLLTDDQTLEFVANRDFQENTAMYLDGIKYFSISEQDYLGLTESTIAFWVKNDDILWFKFDSKSLLKVQQEINILNLNDDKKEKIFKLLEEIVVENKVYFCKKDLLNACMNKFQQAAVYFAYYDLIIQCASSVSAGFVVNEEALTALEDKIILKSVIEILYENYLDTKQYDITSFKIALKNIIQEQYGLWLLNAVQEFDYVYALTDYSFSKLQGILEDEELIALQNLLAGKGFFQKQTLKELVETCIKDANTQKVVIASVESVDLSAGFIITSIYIESLKEQNVVINVINAVEELEGHYYFNESDFITIIKNKVDADLFNQYRSVLLSTIEKTRPGFSLINSDNLIEELIEQCSNETSFTYTVISNVLYSLKGLTFFGRSAFKAKLKQLVKQYAIDFNQDDINYLQELILSDYLTYFGIGFAITNFSLQKLEDYVDENQISSTLYNELSILQNITYLSEDDFLEKLVSSSIYLYYDSLVSLILKELEKIYIPIISCIDETSLNGYEIAERNGYFSVNFWSNNKTDSISTATLDKGWHFLAFCYRSGGVSEFYIDGIWQGSLTETPADLISTFISADQIYLAYNPRNPNIKFHGTLDDLRFYNRALESEEVKSLYDTEIKGLDLSEWHHLVFTYTGQSIVKMYLDGKLIDQIHNSPNFVNSGDFILAPVGEDLAGFCGAIDDFRFYSYPLEGKEINILYTTDSPSFCRIGYEFSYYDEEEEADINYSLYTEEPGDADEISLYQWSHVAITHDKTGNVKIYKDAEPIEKYSLYKNQQYTEDLTIPFKQIARNSNLIGRSNNLYEDPFKGKLDEIRIYNQALSAFQIKEIYNNSVNQHAVVDEILLSNVSFEDMDQNYGTLSGKITITRGITYVDVYVIYWGMSAVRPLYGKQPIAIKQAQGSDVYHIFEYERIPPGATHIIVRGRNEFGETPNGISFEIEDIQTPIHAPEKLIFKNYFNNQINQNFGTITGDLYFQRALNETDINSYNLYWASSSVELLDEDIITTISVSSLITPDLKYYPPFLSRIGISFDQDQETVNTTINFFLKIQNINELSDSIIFYKGSATVEDYALWLINTSEGACLKFSINAQTNEIISSPVTLNSWLYINCVISEDEVRLYLNNVKVGQIQVLTIPDQQGSYYFGGVTPWFPSVAGVFKSVEIFNYVLSINELQKREIGELCYSFEQETIPDDAKYLVLSSANQHGKIKIADYVDGEETIINIGASYKIVRHGYPDVPPAGVEFVYKYATKKVYKILAAEDETTFTHYAVYWGKSRTEKYDNEPIILIPVAAEAEYYFDIINETDNENANYLLIATQNRTTENEENYIYEYSPPVYFRIIRGVPLQAPLALSFEDEQSIPQIGYIEGTVLLRRAIKQDVGAEDDIDNYNLYWAYVEKFINQATIAVVDPPDTITENFTLLELEQIIIPTNATHICLYYSDSNGYEILNTGFYCAINDVDDYYRIQLKNAVIEDDLLSGEIILDISFEVEQFVLYWGIITASNQITTITPDELYQSDDQWILYEFTTATKVPEGSTHLMALAENSYGVMDSGVYCLINDQGIPVKQPQSVSFIDASNKPGFLEGRILIKSAVDEQFITSYNVYWGNLAKNKLSQNAWVVNIPKTGKAQISYKISVTKPSNATELLVYSAYGSYEIEEAVSCSIFDKTSFTFSGSDETYTSWQLVNTNIVDSWLRLTNNDISQLGYAFYEVPFPTTNGMQIQFEYAIDGGSGGDGLCVFLVDQTLYEKDFIGAGGDSLGYKDMKGAALGIGLDVSGGFSGIENTIAIYGSAEQQYPLISQTTLTKVTTEETWLSGKWNLTASREQERKINIFITKSGSIYLLKIRLSEKDRDSEEVVYNVILNSDSGTTLPEKVYVGFSATTGEKTNYHEIRNLKITML